MRTDLKMRKGKMISQGAHASMKIFFDMWTTHNSMKGDGSNLKRCKNYVLSADIDSAVQEWIDGAFTKITVGIDSEEKLVELYEAAKDLNVPCSLVEDNGLTEFKGVKTKTAVAIGPTYPSVVSHITGDLKLL